MPTFYSPTPNEVSITLFCLFKGKSYQKYSKVTSNVLRLQQDRFLGRKLRAFPRLRGRAGAHGKLAWASLDISTFPSLPCCLALSILLLCLQFGRREREGNVRVSPKGQKCCESTLMLCSQHLMPRPAE